MRIQEFQQRIEAIYFARDSARGLAGTHMWFCEEVGELTRALRRDDRRALESEFADVLAWLAAPASTSRRRRARSTRPAVPAARGRPAPVAEREAAVEGEVRSTPTLFEVEAPVRPRPAGTPAPPGFYARVALNRPVPREFTYRLAGALAARASVGARVAVPFANRRSVGVVVELERATEVPLGRMKDVLAVLDDQPVVGPELLGLTRWIATRYACSWGEALAAVLPAPLKRESARRRVPRIRVRPGVGAVELESIAAKHGEQHRLLRTLLEVGGEARLRDLLRPLPLSESPARSLRQRGWGGA